MDSPVAPECRADRPSAWHLDLLQRIAEAAHAAASFPEACRATLVLLLRHCGWPAGHALQPGTVLGGSYVPVRGVTCLLRDAPEGADSVLSASLRMPLSRREGPLAESIRTLRPVWSESLHRDARFRAGVLESQGLRASLIVPVIRKDQVVAALEILSSPEGRPGAALVSTLATTGMQLGHVHARKRLERSVSEAADEVQRVLARELHDSVGQQMSGLSMLALGLARDLAGDGGRNALRARRLHDGILEAQQRLRAVSRGLMPVEVDAGGLVHALHELARSTREMCQVDCRLSCPGAIRVESSTVSTNLFRVAQEAVHNAVAHGQPGRIDIVLERDRDTVRLVIRDDGQGMPAGPELRQGIGLKSIAYRVGLLEGRMEIRSAPGRGTEIRCEIEDIE